jgi:diguanylate cyclase (GGDEF)-like protein
MPVIRPADNAEQVEHVMGLLRLLGEAQEVSSLSTALRAVAEVASLLTDATEAGVFVAEEESGLMRMVASHGLGLVAAGDNSVFVLGIVPWLASEDSRFVTADEGEVELRTAPAAFRKGSFWTPLVQGGQTVGWLVVAGLSDGPPDSTRLKFLRLTAIHATTLIRGMRAQTALNLRVEALTTLAEVGQTLASTLDLDRVLRLIVDGVARLSDATACSIMLLDESRETLRIRMAIGVPEEVVRTAVRKIGEGISGRVAQTGEPVFLRNIADATGGLRGCNPDRYRSPSLVSLPLRSRGQVIGVLNVNDKREGDFSAEDVNLIMLFANQAAFAIDNARLHDQLWQASVTDGLTQTFVHAHFQRRLKELVSAAAVGQDSLAVIMMDIDFFKKVNDQFGHQIGDVVLQGVAALLRRAVRSNDVVARYGGEEFVLILSKVPYRVVLAVAERLRKAVEAATFGARENPVRITASFGVAMMPADATEGTELIRLADENLYASKRGGRNRVTSSDAVRHLAELELAPATASGRVERAGSPGTEVDC